MCRTLKSVKLFNNIDKIDIEEEIRNDNYVITITEQDINTAKALYKELEGRGLKVKAKL